MKNSISVNKFQQFSLLTLFAFSLSITACKKEEEKFLTDASCWAKSRIESTNPLTGLYEETVIEACSKDDCLTFEEDGTAKFDEGATKCDPADPQTTTGRWELSDDKKTLTIGGNPFTVLELSANRLVVNVDLIITKATITYVAN